MLTVHASNDSRRLASLLQIHGGNGRGLADHFLRGVEEFPVASVGIDQDHIVVVATGTDSSAHPWVRSTYSYHIADALTASWPPCDCSDIVPEWLLSGSRFIISKLAVWPTDDYFYVHEDHVRDQALRRSYELEMFDPAFGHYGAIEAIELLTHFTGMNSIVRFSEFINDPANWRQQFKTSFGITVDTFYSMYRAHWNNGLPDLNIQLNIHGEPEWPSSSGLPRIHSVESLESTVRHAIVQVSAGGRTGSGFIYQVDTDGTVWIFTDDFLVGPEGNDNVLLKFFDDVEHTTGSVRGVHPNKAVAVVSACCRFDVKPLDVSSTPMPEPPFGIRVIIFAVAPNNSRITELMGTTGNISASYPGFDHTLDNGVTSEVYFGGTALSEFGQVVGVVSRPRQDDDEFPGLTLTEVDPISLPLDEIIGESDRLREYDTSPELPSYLTLPYERELHTREANAIRIAANTFHAFATDLGLPLPIDPVEIYSHHDQTLLVRYFEEMEGRSTDIFDTYVFGTATRRAVYLTGADTNIRRIKLNQLASRRGLLAHELTHTIFQFRLGDNDSEWPPAWVYEGMATYFTFLVGSYDRRESFSNARQVFDFDGMISPKSTDQFFKYSGGEACDSHCGHAAVELLASRVGVRGLVRFFENGRAGVPWQSTFQQTFGLTVAEFYDLFAEHIEAGFPVLQIPDDPFPEN